MLSKHELYLKRTVDNNLQPDHIAGPNALDIPSIADKQPYDWTLFVGMS